MPEERSTEEKLNEFYRVAWALVEDLTLVDISDDDPIRTKVDTFVAAVKTSIDRLATDGYEAAWEALSEASAGMIGLCRYKDQHLAHVDPDLSRECAQAYRALPEPTDVAGIDAALLNRSFVERMDQAYQGQSRYVGPSKPLTTRLG